MDYQRIIRGQSDQRYRMHTRKVPRPKDLLQQTLRNMGHHPYAQKTNKKTRSWQEALPLCVMASQHLKQAQRDSPPDPVSQHYNLIGAIYYSKQQLELELKFEHMKGHQDLGIPTALSRVVWLNIECNKAAKICTTNFKEGPSQYKIPFEGWCCYINN